MCEETEELYNRARHEASRKWNIEQWKQRKPQAKKTDPFLTRVMSTIHTVSSVPPLVDEKLAAAIINEITTEDIKRWYQLLVGYDEARMKDDMMYGDWRQDEMDQANSGDMPAGFGNYK